MRVGEGFRGGRTVPFKPGHGAHRLCSAAAPSQHPSTVTGGRAVRCRLVEGAGSHTPLHALTSTRLPPADSPDTTLSVRRESETSPRGEGLRTTGPREWHTMRATLIKIT
ncbi:hypothetical protein GCM10010415_08730 [Streptomyces atrovirens]